MTLFDGSMWDRWRSSSWGRSRRWDADRRVRFSWSVNAWEIPLPKIAVSFEEATVEFYVAFGGALNDPAASASLAFVLSDAAADALCVVWPGPVAAGGRAAALGRLRGRS